MIRSAEEAPDSPDVSRPVLLFDGTCTMCSRLVSWFIEHESDQDLRFASLRSDAGLLAPLRLLAETTERNTAVAKRKALWTALTGARTTFAEAGRH